MTTEERVFGVVAEVSGCKVDDLRADMTWDEIGLDSLDVVELTMILEDEFEIEIPDSHMDRVYTLNGAVTYLENRLEGK